MAEWVLDEENAEFDLDLERKAHNGGTVLAIGDFRRRTTTQAVTFYWKELRFAQTAYLYPHLKSFSILLSPAKKVVCPPQP
jgi:hypothetical protein